MNYYIVDDSIATVKVLENIIKVRSLGTVAGWSLDPEAAIKKIREIRPDIVLVDLLMGGIDGITLVSECRKTNPEICFVMISKVSDKKMVQSAYEAGVEFFIQKPVNVIEVEKVLSGVGEKLRMRTLMTSIRNLFPEEQAAPQDPAPAPAAQTDTSRLSLFLGMLGMLGEKGTQDILRMAQIMLREEKSFDRDTLEQASLESGDSTKNIEQRARRAIKKGLTNAANAALEDYSGDLTEIYANYVFDFTALKDEMSSLRDGKGQGGRISLSRFMDGIIAYYKNAN